MNRKHKDDWVQSYLDKYGVVYLSLKGWWRPVALGGRNNKY